MLKKSTQIKFQASLPMVIFKEDDWCISHCPILDVCSQGTTEKEAEKNLKEALHLFFISCCERGTLDEVLKECGFVPGKPLKFDDQTYDKSIIVNIPLFYKRTKESLSVCHA